MTTIITVLLPIRGLAIFFVVAAHAVIGLLAADVNIDPEKSLTLILLGRWQVASVWKTLVLELCRCAVPIFLFLSGYYSLLGARTWKAIWSNCKKMLLPMLFWSLVAWALSWRTGVGGWSVSGFLELLFSGRAQLGYFFIILIIQYYILSKWLVPAVARHPFLVLGGSMLIQLLIHAYDYLYLFKQLQINVPMVDLSVNGPFPEYLFPRFMASFVLGIWAGQYKQSFKLITEKRFPLVLLVAGITVGLLVAERGIIFNIAHNDLGLSPFQATTISWVEWKITTALWTISSIFFFIALFQRWIPFKEWFVIMGKYSFQILILHGMILHLIIVFFFRYFNGKTFYDGMGTIVSLLFALYVPIITAKYFQRLLPGSLRTIIFGS